MLLNKRIEIYKVKASHTTADGPEASHILFMYGFNKKNIYIIKKSLLLENDWLGEDLRHIRRVTRGKNGQLYFKQIQINVLQKKQKEERKRTKEKKFMTLIQLTTQVVL